MIIAITGRIGSGKSTLADYLVSEYHFKQASYGESLKDTVSAIFSWPRELLEGTTDESRIWREQIDEWWASRLSIPHLTPRWVLQYWGTEVGRKAFHDEIWVSSLERKLLGNKENIVITDCRFPNEVDNLKKFDAISIRVERGDDPDWYQYAKNLTEENIMKLKGLGIHESEFSSVSIEHDYIFRNDLTIRYLCAQVDKLIP